MQKLKCKVQNIKLMNVLSICNLHFAICILNCLFILGCASLPRIVILNDPLKAQEHADLASIYEEKGDYDLAIREGEEAVKMDSMNLKALIALGNSHLQKGSYDKAESYYKKAMKIDPKNGDLLNNTAMLYLATGRLDDAERLVKEAIATNSPHVGYYYDTLGKVYEKMGKENEAREAFEKAGKMVNGGR